MLGRGLPGKVRSHIIRWRARRETGVSQCCAANAPPPVEQQGSAEPCSAEAFPAKCALASFAGAQGAKQALPHASGPKPLLPQRCQVVPSHARQRLFRQSLMVRQRCATSTDTHKFRGLRLACCRQAQIPINTDGQPVLRCVAIWAPGEQQLQPLLPGRFLQGAQLLATFAGLRRDGALWELGHGCRYAKTPAKGRGLKGSVRAAWLRTIPRCRRPCSAG